MVAPVRLPLVAVLAALALPLPAVAAPHIFCWVIGDTSADPVPVYFSAAFAGDCKEGPDGQCLGADGSPASFATGARFRQAMAARYGSLSSPSCTSIASEEQAGWVIDLTAKLINAGALEGYKVISIKTGWAPGASTAGPVDGVTEAAALNARITAANLEVQRRNEAAKAGFEAAQAQFRAAQAAYEAEVARQRTGYDEAQRRHAAELKAWQDRVAACKAGDYAKCQ